MTTKSLLIKAISELKQAGLPTPELDAQILLSFAINKDKSFLFVHPEYKLSRKELARFNSWIERRKKGEPIAYIRGFKEFYGYNFSVNKKVLIPRPESEWLVETGLAFLEEGLKADNNEINIVDVGTGSGCIIISISKSLQDKKISTKKLSFFGVDNSREVLKIAKNNAAKSGVENVKFYFSSLLSNRLIVNKKFALIVANLPYVPQFPLLSSDPIAFEPKNAIFAEGNGTAVIKQFLLQAQNKITPGGLILLELDPRNAVELLSFSQKSYPLAQIKLEKDLAGLNRYLTISL